MTSHRHLQEMVLHTLRPSQAVSKSDPLGELPALTYDGNVSVVWSGICVLRLTQDASGRAWLSTLGSATTRSHSFLKATWIWFVNIPDMKQPATGVAVVAV